jgi:hypothetical protein
MIIFTRFVPRCKVRVLGTALLCFATVLNAGVILEVSDGSGPGGTPSPHPIPSPLPYPIGLVLSGTGSENTCLDSGGSNPSCWYQNSTGLDWPELLITFSEPQDITCGGDIFGNCQPQGTVIRFSSGTIKNGNDFHFVLSGWSEGTKLSINAVPEPASIVSVTAGLGVLLLWRVRKRRPVSNHAAS